MIALQVKHLSGELLLATWRIWNEDPTHGASTWERVKVHSRLGTLHTGLAQLAQWVLSSTQPSNWGNRMNPNEGSWVFWVLAAVLHEKPQLQCPQDMYQASALWVFFSWHWYVPGVWQQCTTRSNLRAWIPHPNYPSLISHVSLWAGRTKLKKWIGQ